MDPTNRLAFKTPQAIEELAQTWQAPSDTAMKLVELVVLFVNLRGVRNGTASDNPAWFCTIQSHSGVHPDAL